MLCHAMLCYVCYVMLCYVMLCYVMSCHAVYLEMQSASGEISHTVQEQQRVIGCQVVHSSISHALRSLELPCSGLILCSVIIVKMVMTVMAILVRQ